MVVTSKYLPSKGNPSSENVDLCAKAGYFDLQRRGIFWCRPAEEPLSIVVTQIDAAMAHRPSKVVVPVSAVDSVAGAQFVEEDRPGNPNQFISVQIQITLHQVAIAHMF